MAQGETARKGNESMRKTTYPYSAQHEKVVYGLPCAKNKTRMRQRRAIKKLFLNHYSYIHIRNHTSRTISLEEDSEIQPKTCTDVIVLQ